MAGKYSTNLFEASTHLVANNILSVKYKVIISPTALILGQNKKVI